jgi:hypothetical protein
MTKNRLKKIKKYDKLKIIKTKGNNIWRIKQFI